MPAPSPFTVKFGFVSAQQACAQADTALLCLRRGEREVAHLCFEWAAESFVLGEVLARWAQTVVLNLEDRRDEGLDAITFYGAPVTDPEREEVVDGWVVDFLNDAVRGEDLPGQRASYVSNASSGNLSRVFRDFEIILLENLPEDGYRLPPLPE
ncbi:hypothetical protein GCM10022221_67510 [Actinocorallia aurea]